VGRRSVEEYAEAIRNKYLGSNRAGKRRILDEFCETTSYHRKAAIRLLRRPLAPPTVRARGRGRPRQYNQLVVEALQKCCEASGEICSKRLAPFLEELVGNLERHHHLDLTDDVRHQVINLGPSTIDRLLRPYRLTLRRRGTGHPPTVAHIRRQVPIRTHGEWKDAIVGSVQADLVEHCGDEAMGQFLYTLTVVDVVTGWTECRPVLNKTMKRVRGALHRARLLLPMELRELHTDNGSEFINELVIGYCKDEGIRFTRGRPYRKNDQAFVEQRNWTAVRDSVGYSRYSSRQAYATLEQLYQQQRLLMNFFQPIRKLVSKERHGARVIKRYDRAATAFERLVATGQLDQATTRQLQALYTLLDPIKLRQEIALLRHELWEHRERSRRSFGMRAREEPIPSVTHL